MFERYTEKARRVIFLPDTRLRNSAPHPSKANTYCGALYARAMRSLDVWDPRNRFANRSRNADWLARVFRHQSIGATIRERVHLLRQSNWYWERRTGSVGTSRFEKTAGCHLTSSLRAIPKTSTCDGTAGKAITVSFANGLCSSLKNNPTAALAIPTVAIGCGPIATRNSFQVRTISAALTPR
jgi:hypothetical protein